jgi:hypothetical protein
MRDARAVDIQATTNKRSGLLFQLEQHKNMISAFYTVALVLAISTVPWAFRRIGQAVVGVTKWQQNSD